MIETGHFAELENILRFTLRKYQSVLWHCVIITVGDCDVARTNTTLH